MKQMCSQLFFDEVVEENKSCSCRSSVFSVYDWEQNRFRAFLVVWQTQAIWSLGPTMAPSVGKHIAATVGWVSVLLLKYFDLPSFKLQSSQCLILPKCILTQIWSTFCFIAFLLSLSNEYASWDYCLKADGLDRKTWWDDLSWFEQLIAWRQLEQIVD